MSEIKSVSYEELKEYFLEIIPNIPFDYLANGKEMLEKTKEIFNRLLQEKPVEYEYEVDGKKIKGQMITSLASVNPTKKEFNAQHFSVIKNHSMIIPCENLEGES